MLHIPFSINQNPNQIGKPIAIDILLDKRTINYQVGDLLRLEKSIYENNKLFMSSFDYIVAKLKACSVLNSYKLMNCNISILYCREYEESYDLNIEFFSRIEGTDHYMYFEVETNTICKYITDKTPKIFFLTCYKLIDEYHNPNSLINFAISALKSEEKYCSYDVKNILLARYINIGDLINPENYSILMLVENENRCLNKALITFTIEKSSRQIFLADFSFELSYNLDHEFTNEILLDIKTDIKNDLSRNNFKLKVKKKFLDNKSSDNLIDFVDKKIASSKVLKEFHLEKLYFNTIEVRKNALNNTDFIIEFFKQSRNFEFLYFQVCVNLTNSVYKLYDINCFRLLKIDFNAIAEESIVSESILTLEEEYKLLSIESLFKLSSAKLVNQVYSCYLNIINVNRNLKESGYLLFCKRNNNIAVASVFIKVLNFMSQITHIVIIM